MPAPHHNGLPGLKPALPFDHWSPSKLGSYLRCPRRFRFEYLDHAEPEETSIALLFGSAVHGAVDFLHARRSGGMGGTPEDVLAQFEALLTTSVQNATAPVAYTESHTDLDAHLELGKAMLKVYMDRPAVPNVIAIEHELTAYPGASLPLVGIIDRIDRTAEGTILVELKTAARSWSQADADLQEQVAGYWFMLSACGEPPVSCRFEVLTKTKVPKLQILDTKRTPLEVAQFVDLVQQVERGVVAGCFPRHRSTQTCTGCQFNRKCRGDKD